MGFVTVIYKKDDKSDPNNYRPITLLNTLSKLFERVIYNPIYEHLIDKNLIYEKQSGFLKGHSTSDQLLAITSYIHDPFRLNKDVRGVFLDIEAAFDTVPHKLLLHKLKSYGIRGRVLNILTSYLLNRKIQVRIDR